VRVLRAGKIQIILRASLNTYDGGQYMWNSIPGYEIYGDLEFDVPADVEVFAMRRERGELFQYHIVNGTMTRLQVSVSSFGGVTRWVAPTTTISNSNTVTLAGWPLAANSNSLTAKLLYEEI